jgi:hypothetical protein
MKKKRKPVAWLLKQRGYAVYAEVFLTKKQALEEAQYCRWLGQPSSVVPLYPGKAITVKP